MKELLVAGMAYLDVAMARIAAPPAGQEVFVDAIELGFGGAANCASVGAALGLRVALAVPMGDGIADLALARLAARLGIALQAFRAADDPAISLVLSDAEDRAFVSAADFSALDQVTHLPAAAWIHVPGLEEAARLAAPLARSRREGARIAVSGSWRPERLAQLACHAAPPWDLLVLNQAEAMAACGSVQQAPVLLANCARSVVVTLGAAGAIGVIHAEAVRVAAPEAEVRDPTGAGDALCAGLLAALIRKVPPAAALAFGARAAAHIVRQRGGVLQDRARVAALLREVPWTC